MPVTKGSIDRGTVGHLGHFADGAVTCTWCQAKTPTTKTPPLSVRCIGCRRWVRAEPGQPEINDKPFFDLEGRIEAYQDEEVAIYEAIEKQGWRLIERLITGFGYDAQAVDEAMGFTAGDADSWLKAKKSPMAICQYASLAALLADEIDAKKKKSAR